MFPSEYLHSDNSQLALMSLFENTHDAVFFLDLNGKHLAANNQALDFFGYSLEELQALTVQQTSTEVEKSMAVLARLMAGEKIPLYERAFKKKDGTLVYGEVSVVLVRDTQGNPLIIQSIIRDITTRKEIEHSLKETKEYLEALFKILPVGVSIADAQGNIIQSNQTALEILGFDSHESSPQTIFDDRWTLVSSQGEPIDPQDYPAKKVLREGTKVLGVELGIERTDGSTAWVIVNAAPIPDGGVVMSYVDIREMRKIQESLIEATKIAEQATRTKSQFLANMSHEIRTPLNSMLGFTELLEQTPLEPQQLQYLQFARMSGKTLLEIINDILDYSKIEAGMLDLHPECVDVHEIIYQIIQQLTPIAQRKQVDFVYTQDPPTIPRVMLDPVRIKQILLNLVSNAVKFTNQGTVELSLIYTPKLIPSDAAGTLEIRVKDTGIGISADQQTKLFKAFSQADNSITRNYGGTGLGLVISNMLVQKMGSSIEFESIYGQGSEFSFSLEVEVEQIAEMEEEHKLVDKQRVQSFSSDSIRLEGSDDQEIYKDDPMKKSTTNQTDGVILGTPKIMIVEDVKVNRLLITTYLKKYVPGAEVIEAENGQVALDLLEQQLPDLILMDVQMPLLDGLEATRRIRDSDFAPHKQVPIIALTAAALEGERENCLSAGMTDYLAKPVELTKLYAMLDTYLHPVHS